MYRVGKQKHFANNDEGKEENVGKTFYRKMFSCITAKRAGFGDLLMSYFATRLKCHHHTETIT